MITTIFILVGGAPWIDWQLDQSGNKVNAIVTSVYEKKNVTINNRHPKAIVYEFAADGKTYGGESITMDRKLAQQVERAGQIEVVYLPGDPLKNKMTGTDYSFFGWFILIPFFFAATGGLVFLTGIVKAWKRHSMIHSGRKAVGKVTAVSQNHNYTTNGLPQLIISYEFMSSMRETFRNEFKTFDYNRYGHLKEGSPVEVMHDEFFPEKNTLL